MEPKQEEPSCVTCNITPEGWARIAAKQKELSKSPWRSKHERYYEMEDRCTDAITILGAMTIVSAIVYAFTPWIPEQLIISAAITMGCSALGVMVFGTVRLLIALVRLDSM